MIVYFPLWSYNSEEACVIDFKNPTWTGKTYAFHGTGDAKDNTYYLIHENLPKISGDVFTTIRADRRGCVVILGGIEGLNTELIRRFSPIHLFKASSQEHLFYMRCAIDTPLYEEVTKISSESWKKIDAIVYRLWVENNEFSPIGINQEEMKSLAEAYWTDDDDNKSDNGNGNSDNKLVKPIEKLGRAAEKLAKPLEEASRAIKLFGANLEANLEKRKEKESNMNLFGDLRVGKAGSAYSFTYFGTVAFNGKTYYNGKIYDATGMTLNFDMLYIVPSAEVKKEDIIEKNGKAYYVLDVVNGVVKAVDLEAGTEENLVPGGPFGMSMYAKLFNPMGNMKGENAFGNMLMMQALCGNGKASGDNGMLMAMMMMQGGFKFPTFETPKMPTENK